MTNLLITLSAARLDNILTISDNLDVDSTHSFISAKICTPYADGESNFETSLNRMKTLTHVR